MGEIMKFKLFLLVLILPSYFLIAQEESTWEKASEFEKSRKFFKRSEWFNRQRALPNDTIPLTKLNSEYSKEVFKKSNFQKKNNPEWKLLGPKGITSLFPAHWGVSSGRVKSLAIHPTNPDIVYAGVSSGGIWRTLDGGQSWTPIADDFGSICFGGIAIDPMEPNVIYAGTGEAMSQYSSTIYYGNGVYKSTDNGESWKNIAPEMGAYTHTGDLVVNPHDNNYVYIALTGGNGFLGNPGNGGIWRSTDKGNTWENTLDVHMAFDLQVHPTNPSIIFASVGASGSNSGFYISTDYGSTWSKSSSGLPASGEISRIQFSVCESSPDIIYSLIWGGPTRVYKSTNGGQEWFQLNPANPIGGYHQSLGWYDQGTYDLCIAVHPEQPDEAWAGNVELHKATDGATFSVVRQSPAVNIWDSPVHCDYHKIVYAPSNPDIVYIGSDGGVFKSTDGGNNWQHRNNGISTIQLYWLDSHPTNRNMLIGGAQDNGNFRTLDGGATNWELSTTGDGMVCFYDYQNPSTTYFSIQYGALYKSSLDGAFGTFTDISPAYQAGDNAYWTAPFFQHPSESNTLYSASRKVWKSTNGGNSWIAVSTTFGASINSMHQSKYFPEVMIAVAGGNFSSNPPIYVSTDEGVSWANITNNIPGGQRFVPTVLTDPNLKDVLYVVRSGFGSGKVYKSNDLGISWEDISGNLPDIPHNDLIVDPDIPGYMYVANDFGIYQTTDSGNNWTFMDNGIPIVPVLKLDYVDYNSVRLLRAGTYGRSVYETELQSAEIPFLTLINPIEGANLVEGAIEQIRWVSKNLESISIFLTTDSKQTWTPIAENISSDELIYNWQVPSSYSENCQIKIVDNSGTITDIISEGTFSINPFVSPQLNLPVNGEMALKYLPALFSWEQSAGAEFYSMQIAEDENFTTLVFDETDLPDNFIDVEVLEAYSQYYWRVNAKNTGLTTPYSNVSTFRTAVAVPNILYPPPSMIDLPTSFQFKWDPVLGADNYSIQVSTDLSFSDLIVNEENLSDTKYDISDLDLNRRYFWKVKAKNQYGDGDFSERIWFRTVTVMDASDETSLPRELKLSQNYPNPFNPSTNFRVEIPEEGFVNLTVYNVLGEQVAELLNNYIKAGYYEVTFNAGELNSGVYLYKISYKNKVVSKKMLYLK